MFAAAALEQANLNTPPIELSLLHTNMRRVPRLRAAVSAGIVPSSTPSGALRVPAAATLTSTSTLPSTSKNTPTRRYLSTTPLRPSQPPTEPQTQAAAEVYESYQADFLPPPGPAPQAQLVYPRGVTTAPNPTEVADPAYRPAETADGLEEVGGIGGWWDKPAHWGSEGGAAQFVRSVITPFGRPAADRVTDPAVLEVLAKRAIVEALVVARFAGAEKRKAVDRLFSHAGGSDRLGKIVRAEVVAGPDGTATLKDSADWARVWSVLKSAVVRVRDRQQEQEREAMEQAMEQAEGEATEAAKAVEAAEAAVPEVEAKEVAPAPQLTPQVAKSFVGTWNKEWKKAELRDPVVKFYVSLVTRHFACLHY